MWHPHSDSWSQWPIQQSAYANVPAEQVDWGALAQQWIAHKEHAVHLPVTHGVSDVGAHGHGPPYPSWSWSSAPTAPAGADWSSSSSGGGHSSSWHSSGPVPSANPDVAVPPPVPQYVDYGHGNYEVQGFDYNHGGVATTLPTSTSWDYQSTSVSAPSHPVWPPEPASQPPPPPPPPPPEEVAENVSQSLILVPDTGAAVNDAAVGVSEAAPHRAHHHHHHRRQSQHVVAHVPVIDADDSASISEAKRKILPSWIREGLEKMEREKMKKLEREKQEKEREEKEKLRVAAEKAAADAKNSEQSGEPTLPRKSRFDTDGDDTRHEKVYLPAAGGPAHHSSESFQSHTVTSAATSKPPVSSSSNILSSRDAAPVTAVASGMVTVDAAQPQAPVDKAAESSSDEDDKQSLSAEEKQRRLIEKVKEMLTTVLKDVTDEQIRAIAKETYVKCRQRASKAPAKQLAKSSALASLTMFGAGDDSDDSESGNERKRKSAEDSSDSDEEEAEYRLRKKKAEFHKAQRERLLRLEREEQLARDASENTAVKEEHSSEKKPDASRGRDDAKVSDDSSLSIQQGSRQSPVHGQSVASSSGKTGQADVQSDHHERHQHEHSPDDAMQNKYERHKGERSSEVAIKSDQDDAISGRRTNNDQDKKIAKRSASHLSSPDRIKSEPSKSSGSGAAARDESCRESKSPVTKGSKQGAGRGSPEAAVNNVRSTVPSKDKEAKKRVDGSGTSRKYSEREHGSVANSDASSDSDSDSSTSSSSRSRDDRQSAKKRANSGERDRSPGRRREREGRRERSRSASVKRSSDVTRDSRKSGESDKKRSHKKHSRRSSSRDSLDRYSSRRRHDKKDNYRRSSRSPSRKGRRSRSPVAVRKASSDKRRDRSEDRSSKRRRREASTSESEERGGKKASHKTSRWAKLTCLLRACDFIVLVAAVPASGRLRFCFLLGRDAEVGAKGLANSSGRGQYRLNEFDAFSH